MAEETENYNKTIIQELNDNAVTGFNKSVDELYNNIIAYLKHRTADGFRVCKYNYIWREFGSIMSPIHIGYQSGTQNSVLLPDTELQKLICIIRQKLLDEQIIVGRCEAQYVTTNNVNYTMRFEIDLEVPDPMISQEQNSPCEKITTPEPPEFDFKCASC